MRTITDVLQSALFEKNNKSNLKSIDIPRYYNVNDLFSALQNIGQSGGVNEPEKITFIATSKNGYRCSILNGFHTIYLYDILDFTEDHYYVKGVFTADNLVIIENSNLITGELLENIYNSIPATAILINIYDSHIPNRYFNRKDTFTLQCESRHYINKINTDKKYLSLTLKNFLNKIRTKNMKIQNILQDGYVNSGVNIEKIDKIKVSDIIEGADIPIITPHTNLIKVLNNRIRDYLGFTNSEKEYLPKQGEPMITHGPAECTDYRNGKIYCLPFGYRFKVKRYNIIDNNVCQVFFDYERFDGEILECTINIAIPYLEYLVKGDFTNIHPEGSFKVFYGYVIPSFLSSDLEFDKAIVIYDYTISNVKEELYNAILPAKKEVKIYYSLDDTIINKII